MRDLVLISRQIRVSRATLNGAAPPCASRGLLIMWLTVAVAAVASPDVLAQPAATRPNIVVILVDDMGYGDPGCFNSESRIPTPHIDRLAREGMKFTDAHASGPLCHVSRYGLMTGRYPFRANVGRWSQGPTIANDQPTVPAMLKSVGYRTAMIGKWHLGFHENGYDRPLRGGPVDRGFDTFFGIRASTDIPPYFYIRGDRAVSPPTVPIEENHTPGWSPIQGAFWRKGLIAPDMQLKDVLPRFTQEAVGVIQEHAEHHKSAPLMLYLAYPAPHTPWLPSEEFQGRSGAGLYGDFAAMVDANIGVVLDALHEQGMADNTLVVFSSDNGPVWYPTDVQRFHHDSCGGWRGMKADIWEAGHRMPFIVRWPGVVRPSTVSDRLVSFVDLFATFAEVVGYSLPDNAAPDSFSFLPALRNSTADTETDTVTRSQLVVQSGRGLQMIRDGHWKLITGLGSGGFSKPSRQQPEAGQPVGQLYNLKTDPGETNNQYDARPELVKRLNSRLKEINQADSHRLLKDSPTVRD